MWRRAVDLALTSGKASPLKSLSSEHFPEKKIGKAFRFVSAGGMFAAIKPSQDGDFLVATAPTDAFYSGPPLAARQSSTIYLASN